MKAKNLFNFILSLGIVAVPSLSHAHFLWVSLDPKLHTVAVGLQEVPSQTPLPLGDRASRVQLRGQSGHELELKADATWLKGSTSDSCVGASLDYGVIDRRDGGRGVFWLKYYAKAAATARASERTLHLPVELMARFGADGKPVVTVLKDGKPSEGADVVVEDATGTSTFTGTTAADGTATLPASMGPIEVRALVTENTPGTHEGKAYDLIRTYSTLTIQSSTPKPLTKQLREAFGNMHDVVGNTAFINTVMANGLTKQQLVDHLQQRALIHEAVDHILSSSRIKVAAYDAQQKEVMSLLRTDLENMGASWPTPSQAWPLTKEFLAEIKRSAKAGPYFALGVFHVYYGGITHGGRDIGDMITGQLKFNLTYYEKSDGYTEYAKAVDTVTDPKAQQEMIRGGVDAYHYIIAVNNVDAFKNGKGSK